MDLAACATEEVTRAVILLKKVYSTVLSELPNKLGGGDPKSLGQPGDFVRIYIDQLVPAALGTPIAYKGKR